LAATSAMSTHLIPLISAVPPSVGLRRLCRPCWFSPGEDWTEHERRMASIPAKRAPNRIAGLAALRCSLGRELLIHLWARRPRTRRLVHNQGRRRQPAPHQRRSALKAIDPAAFQAVVDAAAKELLVPGAVVLLRTPQGETMTRWSAPQSLARRRRRMRTLISGSPRNTKTMTVGADRAACPGRQASQFSDPVSTYVSRCAQRQETSPSRSC